TVQSLLESGEYSDLEIRCKDDTHKVHKAIVCPQSEFFRRALKPGTKESQSGVIELHEADPAVVKAMVQFLYRRDYDAPELDDDNNPAIFHANTYAAAEMYQVHGLKDRALQHFKSHFPSSIELFAKMIDTVYSTTLDQDRSLRDYVVEQVVRDMDRFRNLADLSLAMEEQALFGKDLFYGLHDYHITRLKILNRFVGRDSICPNCRKKQSILPHMLFFNKTVACRSCFMNRRADEYQ
ncbi:BTB/POZ protein, partial [Phyllosticta capitalensis]